VLDRLRQNPLIILLAIVCVVAIVVAYTSVGKASEATPQNQRTAKVQEGVVQSTVSGSGTLTPASSVGVNFAKTGTLTAVFVKVGDHVKRGQLLAETSPSSARSSLRSAEIALSTADASYKGALEGLTPAEQHANRVSAEQSETSVKSSGKTLRADQATAKSDKRSADATISQDRLSLKRAEAAQSVETESQQHTVEHAITQRVSDETKLGEARGELEKAKTKLQEAKDALQDRKNESPSSESKVQSAESKVTTDEGNVTTLESTVKADELKVNQEDAYTITSAKTTQAAAAVKGQQTLDSSRATLENAKQTLSSTLLKDHQTVAAARVSLKTAEQTLQATLASNATKAQPPKNSTVVSAANTVKTDKLTVESDKRAISETRLYAPADGTVASIGKTVGEAVTGSGASSGESESESGSAASTGGSESANSTGSTTTGTTGTSTGSSEASGGSGSSNEGTTSTGASTGTTGTSTGSSEASGGSGSSNEGTTSTGASTGTTGTSSTETGSSSTETGSSSEAARAESASADYQEIAYTGRASASPTANQTSGATYTGGAKAQTIASTSSAGGSTGGTTSSSSSSTSSTSESSSPFIELVDVHGYQVKVPLSESEISGVRVGQSATVTVEALESKKFAATVVALPVVSTESNSVVSYEVTFQLEQTSAQLKPGMTVTAEVVIKQAEGVNVATSAIKNGSVTVLRNGKQVQQTVTTGLAGDTTTLIKSGLKAGETIVLSSASTSAGSSAKGSSKTSGASAGGGISGGGAPGGG
jgi:multidrug efflux pump subunit AcrA (membrane-fusion protein)